MTLVILLLAARLLAALWVCHLVWIGLAVVSEVWLNGIPPQAEDQDPEQ